MIFFILNGILGSCVSFHGFILPFLAVIDPNSFGLVTVWFTSMNFKLIWGKRFVDFLEKYLGYRKTLYDSKQEPKWRFLVEKNFIISQQQIFFPIGQINGSKSCFVLCQLLKWSEWKYDELMWKALEWGWKKLVLGLSLTQILPEKINKMPSPDIHGFIDVNRTVT